MALLGIHVGKSWLFHRGEARELGVVQTSPVGEDGVRFGINPPLNPESSVVGGREPSCLIPNPLETLQDRAWSALQQRDSMKSPLAPRFPDPEPPEAQEGQEEAAEAGGEEGHAGPAAENACEEQHGHGMRQQSGKTPLLGRAHGIPGHPAPFQGFFLGLSALDKQDTAGERGSFHKNRLLDAPIPAESGCCQCRRLELNFAFPKFAFSL